MKINVTVDLDDMYTESSEFQEGASFTEEIKAAIMHEVKGKVLAQFRENGELAFTAEAKKQIDEVKDGFIIGIMQKLVSDAKIRKYGSGQEMITTEEYIIDQLKTSSLGERQVSVWLDEKFKQIADSVAKQMIERYDLKFAAQIVAKLNDNGMLKDDIAKILLDK